MPILTAKNEKKFVKIMNNYYNGNLSDFNKSVKCLTKYELLLFIFETAQYENSILYNSNYGPREKILFENALLRALES